MFEGQKKGACEIDKTKVLIVDDNEELAALIKTMIDTIIDREGLYHVKTAVSGEEGYKVSLDFKPDIIVTDILMPGRNGLEMVRAIRAHYPRVRTIYMSGDWIRFRTLLEEEHARYQANFLKKPFGISDLEKLLSKMVA